MSYYTFHYDGAKATHRYISDNIHIIRQQTGRVDVPIHPIGGLVADTSKAEAQALVQAARERGVTGVSLYEYGGMTGALWSALRPMPVQPGVLHAVTRRRSPRPARSGTSRAATPAIPRRRSSRPGPRTGRSR